jgi:hypothetical protein
LSKRAKEGKPLYGETDLDEHMQGIAYRNSAFSQLKFGALLYPHICCHLLIRYLVLDSSCHPMVSVPWLILALHVLISTLHRFNLANHKHHGTDPAKYGVKAEEPK